MNIYKFLSYFSLIPDWIYDYTFLAICCYGAYQMGYTEGFDTAYNIYSSSNPYLMLIPQIGV